MRPKLVVLQLLLLALLAESAIALSCLNTLTVWPLSGVVPANAQWIVEVNRPAETSLRAFFLAEHADASATIPLEQVSTAGAGGRWQVVLRPSSPLPVGSGPYVLMARVASVLNPTIDRQISLEQWLVGPSDRTAPRWLEHPRIVDSSATDSDWGQSLAVEILAPASEPVAILAEIRGHANPLLRRFELFLLLKEDLAKAYSGPCGGNLHFPSRGTYSASLTAINAGGNKSKSAPRIRIRRPR